MLKTRKYKRKLLLLKGTKSNFMYIRNEISVIDWLFSLSHIKSILKKGTDNKGRLFIHTYEYKNENIGIYKYTFIHNCMNKTLVIKDLW